MDLNFLKGKAEELLNEHGDKVEAAAEKVGDLVKDKYGHEEQVDLAVDKIKEMIPDPEAGQPTGQ
ncbi:Rv0909 family putative TA system antitoxin [Pseudonocardia hispaniensis]|uniref:Rv0909 family putative TA system antitoxin n=1 Tax=Pseudonocardia hispaniensis TaxID=904933 RepID=A0ABW1J1H2_9PSEU